ncbi:structural protein [Hovenia dulcis-associated virus 2]|nr:structural protein [Hovenia dulcis-associated virus 2]
MNKQNEGTESGQSDTSHTESAWGGADKLSEWENGPDNHIGYEGQGSGTLLGPSESKKYNDSTGFISEGRVETKRMDEAPEDKELLSALHPSVEQRHTIETIISRPTKIDTITFNSQSSSGEILGFYDVIQIIRDNSRLKLFREKLSAFYGVNMTAHLKVLLNAQPMESGLFQIFFVPFYRTEGSVLAPTQFTSNYESMLPYTTGCPNIPCNISKQSEVELAIPYTGPVAFMNLTNSEADFGTFFVQSIVPISDSTNNASVEMTVMMYFTDVKLFGTTANNVIARPQGIESVINSLKPSECSEDKMKRGGGGPISQIGNSLLPIIDSLGLSAPDANPNTTRMAIDPFGSPATVDTTCNPLKVSYTFKHHLDIGQLGVNSQSDEMDLRTIASKPCYYNQFTWTTSNDADTRLQSYTVEPNCKIKNDSNVTAPTRLRFVANNFRYWRGTIKFLFMVVGNQYHSGRLRFVYSLGGPLPQSYPDNYPRAFTQIVDIRKGAHFIVECPYFASTPWRLTPQFWDDTNNYYREYDSGSLDDVPATLDIFVENELRATQTTSTSIQIVCMQSAGADFEFACPIATRSRPYINAAVPDGEAPAASDNSFVVEVPQDTVASPQGLDFMPLNMATGLSDISPIPKKPHKYTVGEDINNVRQLIKRYQLLGYGTITDNTPYVIYPFAQTRPEGTPTLSYDALAVFSTLYQFRRGSIRFLFKSSSISTDFTLRYDPELGILDVPIISNTRPFGDVAPIREVTQFASGVALLDQRLTCTIPFRSHLQGGMEVEFPYYSRFHKLKTAVFPRDSMNSLYTQQIRQGRVPAGLAFFITYNNPANTTLEVYRAAADDFTLGYLLGAPLCQFRQFV